jgi:hypothetical protein
VIDPIAPSLGAIVIPVSKLDTSPLESLTPDQRAWILEDERRWRRAYAIAAEHPGTRRGGNLPRTSQPREDTHGPPAGGAAAWKTFQRPAPVRKRSSKR